MFFIALRSLLHYRARLVVALVGVAFATMLVLVQYGIYRGFVAASTELPRALGGDVWVSARGVDRHSNGEPLAPEVRALVRSHPCVRSARGLIMQHGFFRRPNQGLEMLQLIGIDELSVRMLPWSLEHGIPRDLLGPMRVSVDVLDAHRFELDREILGHTLPINGHPTHITVLTRGIRSFALTPLVFMSISTARTLTGMTEDQASYWLLEVERPACVPEVLRYFSSRPQLQAVTLEQFAAVLEDGLVKNSGIGLVLGFVAALGFVVAVVIVSQTLYAIARDHEHELAMLRVAGASRYEVARFVLWQALFVAFVGSLFGLFLALLLQRPLDEFAVRVLLPLDVVLPSLAAVAGSCLLASLTTIQRVLLIEPSELLR